MDEGHLAPFLQEMRKLLAEAGVPMSDKNILATSGRVRAGYRIGELERADPKTFSGMRDRGNIADYKGYVASIALDGFASDALDPLDQSKGVDFENLFAIGVVK